MSPRRQFDGRPIRDDVAGKSSTFGGINPRRAGRRACNLLAPRLLATQLSYLQIPSSGSASLPQVYNLPGYGNVQVSVTNNTPVTYFDQINAYNQSAGGYTWGTDTQRFSVLNTTGSTEQYQFDFTFLSGAPNPADLELVVVGLAVGTTALVSQSGTFTGEYTFPASGFYPFGPSSTTSLSALTFGSNGDGDLLNTGWALYQPAGTFTNLSLGVNQVNGDGIGFTLAYVPEPSTICLLGVGAAARRSRGASQAASENR